MLVVLLDSNIKQYLLRIKKKKRTCESNNFVFNKFSTLNLAVADHKKQNSHRDAERCSMWVFADLLTQWWKEIAWLYFNPEYSNFHNKILASSLYNFYPVILRLLIQNECLPGWYDMHKVMGFHVIHRFSSMNLLSIKILIFPVCWYILSIYWEYNCWHVSLPFLSLQ